MERFDPLFFDVKVKRFVAQVAFRQKNSLQGQEFQHAAHEDPYRKTC